MIHPDASVLDETRPDDPRSRTAPTRLIVRTEPVDETEPLIPRADPRHPLLWMRRGEGIVGLGEVARIETRGRTRIEDAAAAWRSIAADALVDDRVGLPGTGLVAFGAFAFADASASTSVLIVPELVLGRRDGRAWVTRIALAAPGEGADDVVTADELAIPDPAPKRQVPRVAFSPGAVPPDAYEAAVAEAVHRIEDGSFQKVVLARQLVGELHEDAGLRAAINRLAEVYPDTWVFAVDGLIGASPETLVRVDHGTVSARVLAGTTSRGAGEASDRDRAAALAASPKDLDEHALAVASVVERSPRTPPASTRVPSPSPCSCPTSGTSPPTSRARSATGRPRSTS